MALAGLTAYPHHVSASKQDAPPGPRTISVVSLNTAREIDAGKIMSDLNAAPRLRSADLLLLQEVANENGRASVADQLAQRLGYFVAFSPATPGVYDQGLALVSRYPISDTQIHRLKACNLRFHCRQRFALSANIRTPWGDLRVWNAHLDTRINSQERTEQLQPVLDAAARYSGPRLIGGDFNTNDWRWVGNVVPFPGGPSHGQAVRQVMARNGFVTPFANSVTTFPVFHRHLDWIFVRDLKSLGSSVEPAPFSDHNAIWARFLIPNGGADQRATGESLAGGHLAIQAIENNSSDGH
jgi:endonuclease/exonuclease/phosphatase family metal-dependent hydrolase